MVTQVGPDWGASGSPNLGSVGTTPAVSTIKALQQGLSSSKSVSILASGCSDPNETPLASAAGMLCYQKYHGQLWPYQKVLQCACIGIARLTNIFNNVGVLMSAGQATLNQGSLSCAGHGAPSSIAESISPRKQASSPHQKEWTLRHWVQLVAVLALVISPAVLLLAGHIAAGSSHGRERLASGAYGSGAASFGRCVQHMLAPEALADANYMYQPQQGSAWQISEELACLVAVAAGEGQRGLGAAAVVASEASLSLHANSVSMAAHMKRLLSPVLQLCGGPAKTALNRLHSMLERLCPDCTESVSSVVEAIQQLSLQHARCLENPEALSSKLRPVEHIASWAPAKPSSIIQQLLDSSQAVMRLVPEPVRAPVTGAWTRASTWLHMCATWQPSQQPQLTALHSAVYVAHYSANKVLHSVKQAACCACSTAEHASSILCGAAGSISAKAAATWESCYSLLQYASLAAMTHTERDAHVASRMTHDDTLGPATHEQAPAAGKGIAGWLSSLWNEKETSSGSTAEGLTGASSLSGIAEPEDADSSASGARSSPPAVEHAEGEGRTVPVSGYGLTHVQLEGRGVITWDGQAAQPEPPAGQQAVQSEDGGAPDEARPEATVEGQNAGLQHSQSGEGGTVTWAGRPNQDGSEAEDASPDPHVPTDETPMDLGSPPGDSHVALSHTQTEGGGSVTWTGQATEPDPQHGAVHRDPIAAEAAGSGLVPDRVRQAGGGEPDQDAEAISAGSAAPRSAQGARQPEAQADKPTADLQPAVVQHADEAAGDPARDAPEDVTLHSSGTRDVRREPSDSAPGTKAAAAGAEPDMGAADAMHDSTSRGGSAESPPEGRHVAEQDSSDGGTEGHAGSSAEDIAGALADAVHTLERAQGMQQSDQGSWAHEAEGGSEVARAHLPAAALSRLSKLAEVGLSPEKSSASRISVVMELNRMPCLVRCSQHHQMTQGQHHTARGLTARLRFMREHSRPDAPGQCLTCLAWD